MAITRRLTLCVLSSLLAAGTIAGLGGWQHLEKILHRWFHGLVLVFLLVFTLLIFFTMRGRFARPFWVVPVAALLAYPAATISHLAYFAVMEPERTVNTLTKLSTWDVIAIELFIVPTVSGAWLFGAVAGTIFLAIDRGMSAAGWEIPQ
jgi:hypothetical protein